VSIEAQVNTTHEVIENVTVVEETPAPVETS